MISGLRGHANPAAPGGKERRTWFGYFARMTFGPILLCLWYWLDLNDPTGRPEHGKVLSAIAFFWGVVVLSTMAPFVADLCRESRPGCGSAMTFFLAFATLVFAMAFSIEGFRIFSKYRGGGATDALAAAAPAAERAAAEVAVAEIQQRRSAGGDYEATA